MDKRRLEHLKQKLLQKQAELTEMVQRTESYGREKDGNIQDIADQAVSSYTKELMFGMSSGDRQVLQLIREALDRIEKGDYGVCANCGKEIQPRRMEAVPWTKLCIQCQDLLEKGLLKE